MEDLKKEPKNIIGINTSNISKVKSFYIVKEIFSYLDEKTKLDIIKYSKKLQDKFEIDIEDYIEKSGRYKTGERNGQGKEYLLNTNLLIFEGEYLNNKRHGLGEEYDYNGNLIYKGGYLNGKRHGNGEEYDPYDWALIIKGEYKNGKLWNGKGFNHVKAKIENGNGKIESYITFDDYLDKNIKFEGQYINGEINGKGKEYYGDILIFEGEYLKGKKWNGKGYNNLELDLKNGNGKFKFYYENGKINYEGKYINGIIQGYCKRYDEYGNLVFEGNIYDGKANGKGREYLNGDNVKYEGEYLNGEWHGKGREYNNKGKIIFIGEYLNGYRHKGKEYNRFCKVKFNGEYDEEGERLYGEEYSRYGQLIYEGGFKNNKRHGQGKEYDINNDWALRFEGKYCNGEKSCGKVYDDYGRLLYEGDLYHNKRHGWGKAYDDYYYSKVVGEFAYGNFLKGYAIDPFGHTHCLDS